MPLPLIAVAAVSAGYGLYKSGKAYVDNSDANELNESAKDIVESAQKEIENSRQACNNILTEFGRKKVEAITNNIEKFVSVYGQLKNVQLTSSHNLGDLKIEPFDSAAFDEMKSEISMVEASGLGLGSGSAGGALAAFGAYNGAMMLASASTGTAISSLGGAAATNATLAWFGGGSLASGGLGMAGGTMVLGGLVAGPALAIFGGVMGAKAEEKLSNAKSNKEEADTFASSSKEITIKLSGIIELTELAIETLSKLRTALRRSIKSLDKIIQKNGVDYSTYLDSDKEIVFKTVKLAQLVKALIDTPLLDDDGGVLEGSQQRLIEIKAEI